MPSTQVPHFTDGETEHRNQEEVAQNWVMMELGSAGPSDSEVCDFPIEL